MIRLKTHPLGAALGVVLALAAGGQAWACMPASDPLPTAEQHDARQAAFQSRLWAGADAVFIAAVTRSEATGRTLNVTLAPSLAIKGQEPARPFVVSDAMSNCRPGGIMGGGPVTVGEVYVVYRNAHGDLVVHEDNLADPATRAAWTEAAARAAR